jgi:hypothetical protein
MLAVLLALLVVAPAAAPAEPPLVVRVPETLVVEHPKNAAHVTVHLKNASPGPRALYLSVDDFVAKSTGTPLGTTATFAVPGGAARTPVYAATLPAGAQAAVTIEVANLWEAGESTAKLYDHDRVVATLRAVKSRVPLGVRVVGAGENPPVLAFQRGRPREVVVKNDDGMTYDVEWRLLVNDAVATGTVTLPPNGAGTLSVTPRREWFSAPIEGLFKDETKDGMLTLRFRPGATTNVGASEQSIALRAQLTYWPLWLRQPITMIVVFSALLAGGLCSLLLNQWFPNRIRRVDLEERLNDIATRTRNLSFRIDSSLRILVRVERYRLLRLLDSRYTFSPEMADVLAAAAQAVTRLEAKVALLERIDIVDSDMRRLRLVVPPTVADGVDAQLRKASDRLRGAQPSDTELQEAGTLLGAAATTLEAAGQTTPEFAAGLAARFERLHKGLDAATPPRATAKGQSIARTLGGLFQYIDGAPPGGALRPEQYFEHDARLVRLDLVHDYLALFAHQTDAVRARLEAREGAFLALVGAASWDKTLAARHLIQEMRDDIYADEVEAEMLGKRLRIVAQPTDPRPHQAVELSAVFENPAYNACGARDEYMCEWAFAHEDSSGRPTTWREEGWTVHHFFPKPKTYTVQVSFRRKDGTPVADQSKTVTVIAGDVTVGSDTGQRFGSRTKIEAVRFGIVLVATIVGLVGGARDQLMKLDVAAGLIAVFLIGFGADAVKNILVDRSAAPPKK